MKAAASWAEQRFFNELAVRTLEESGHKLASKARAEMDLLVNVDAPSFDGYVEVSILF